MNELEKYIREHAAEFDAAKPAEGHEERFLARLAVTQLPQETRREPSRRFAPLLRMAWIPALVCAALAAAFLLIRPGDPFRNAGNDPEAIYLAYLGEVARIYEEMPAGNCADRDEAIRNITEEADPYFDQLPDEYPAEKRARMIKSYYAELLALAEEVNEKY
jgi:hypothetical protein